MYINPPNLIKDANSMTTQRFIMRSVINRVKLYTDKRFKGRYPRYISGMAYLISGDVVGALYKASLTVTLFWLEDVYITGFLAEKVYPNHIDNWKFRSVINI